MKTDISLPMVEVTFGGLTAPRASVPIPIVPGSCFLGILENLRSVVKPTWPGQHDLSVRTCAIRGRHMKATTVLPSLLPRDTNVTRP